VAREQFSFKAFFITIKSWTLFSNSGNYSRYLVVVAFKPAVTVQSQICGTLTVSSMISPYLAGEYENSFVK